MSGYIWIDNNRAGMPPKFYFASFLLESKLQVLANLANFAYDPINYEHLRKLNVVDLFLGKFPILSSLFHAILYKTFCSKYIIWKCYLCSMHI